MSAHQQAAQRYLSPAQGAFWKWSLTDRAVEWSGGGTLAFVPELEAVLGRLAEDGLPPLDLVLLWLAACRDGQEGNYSPLEHIDHFHRVFDHSNRVQLAHWTQLAEGLGKVREIPAPFRSSLAGKAELGVVVLGRIPGRLSPEISREVLAELKAGFPPEPGAVQSVAKPLGDWIRDYRSFSDGLARLRPEMLELRLKTGLDQLPVAAPDKVVEIEQPVVATPTTRDLLQELERDPEHRGLARLVRRLQAIVHLPRPISDREDLPLGGVSDVTNRGPLDRLLLSELANDDDVLTTRIALNEALYLRRETPPSHPPRERLILIDSGIRMWGLPRVFATAAALALAAGSPHPCRVFRASRRELAQVDLTTRAGLLDYLSALESAAHPGAALPAFQLEIEAGPCEVVLITTPDAEADPEFRQVWSETALGDCHLLLVDRDGSLSLTQRTARGDRLVRQVRLDIQEILEPPPKNLPPPEPLLDKSRDPKLPAILRLSRFPLRLSHPIHPQATVRLRGPRGRDIVVSLARDGRLMLWDEPGRGAVELARGITWGEILAAEMEDSTALLVIRNHRGGTHLVRADLQSLEVKEIPLEVPHRRHPEAFFHAGFLFLRWYVLVHVYSPRDGAFRLQKNFFGEFYGGRGRFLLRGDGWHAASCDGTQIVTEKVGPFQLSSAQVMTVFDSQALQAPVAIRSDGSIESPPQPIRRTDRHPESAGSVLSINGISRDGNRCGILWWHSTSPPVAAQQWILSIPEGTWTRTSVPLRIALADPFADICHQRELRSRLKAVEISDKNDLILISRQGTRWELSFRTTTITFQPESRSGPFTHYESFGARHRVTGEHARFQEAKMSPDGSTIKLDSQGLLHFRSSDTSIPEFTLVLYDRDIAAWCADGRVWGSRYFLEDSQVASPNKELHQLILRFIYRLEYREFV